MKHYLGICLILLTLAVIFLFVLHSCVAASDHTITSIRDAFAQVLHVQPQVTVNQRVVMTQTAPIAELAVVTNEELVQLGFSEHLEVLSYQVPLTEKKLTVAATYRLKAGFDLREPFSVEIDPATHALKAAMPHAKVLSVEQIGDLTYQSQDAAFNRITDDERARIVNSLNSAARDTADRSSMKADAEQQVTERLKELMKHNGQTITIEWTQAKPQTPSPAP